MKHYLLFLFLLFFLGLKAQDSNLEIIKSKVFKNEKYKTSLVFAKEDTNGDIFLVRNYFIGYAKPKGYHIQHFDKDLNLLKTTSIPIKRSEIRGLFLIENKIVLIEFRYIQKEKRYAFVAYISSKGEINFTEKELLSIDREKIQIYDHYGVRKEVEFNANRVYKFGQVVSSKNDEFIAINLYLKKGENEQYNIHVFNKNLELEYHKSIDLFVNETTGEIDDDPLLIHQNLEIDSKGRTYVLTKHYKKNRIDEKKKGQPNYTYELFKISKNNLENFSIKIEDLFIGGLKLLILDDKLSCVGFYSDELGGYFKRKQLKGIVRFNIDLNTFSISSKSYKPFPKQFLFDKYGKEVDKGIYGFILRDIEVLKNDELVLLGEEFSIYYNEYGGPSGLSFKDIFAFKIDKSGNFIWARSINKDQSRAYFKPFEHYSFSSIINNEDSYLFFNAEKNNKILKDGRIIYKTDKKVHQLFVSHIDNSGNLNTKMIFKDLYSNTSLGVRFGIQLKDNKLLLEGLYNEEPQLFIISL